MAELVGTVVAAAQAAEYCLKLYTFFDRAVRATDTLQRYLNIIQESRQLLTQISTNPSLQTIEIQNCTNTFLDIIKTINVPDNPQKRNRLLTSIVLAIKQKQYDEAFALLEEKKSTLSLYIATSHSTVLSDIQADVRHIRSQSVQNLLDARKDHDTSTMFKTTGYRLGGGDGSSVHTQTATPATPADTNRNADSENGEARFENNVSDTSGVQTVGVELSPGSKVTNRELLEITKNHEYIANKSKGEGDQVVGLYAKRGARPRAFAGKFKDNSNHNQGDQVVGIRL
ncbi:hypothetical protein Hte_009849 [Hypoxylon texense]